MAMFCHVDIIDAVLVGGSKPAIAIRRAVAS